MVALANSKAKDKYHQPPKCNFEFDENLKHLKFSSSEKGQSRYVWHSQELSSSGEIFCYVRIQLVKNAVLKGSEKGQSRYVWHSQELSSSGEIFCYVRNEVRKFEKRITSVLIHVLVAICICQEYD
ncbi:unnamed protein product [Larinioides sclopetarius]|uniref:Uncharacterized protein n=1 Tax=Larinioides sclopetarius TaxID=280406 RepID=A0AAV2BGR8_9ARAC